MIDTNYFTCTLGQTSLLPKDRDYKNINDFIVEQAIRVHNLPAVGFYTPRQSGDSSWTSHILTFSDIQRGTYVVAGLISQGAVLRARCTVALLCPSSAEFLFVWLAFMRLGHPVLLLAPQCSASAVAQLCESCEVKYLFHDEMYKDLATKASREASTSGSQTLSCISLGFLLPTDIYEILEYAPKCDSSAEKVSEYDVAYLHHTSGTSSGSPKPIPQTHRAGIGVLPALDGKHEATFTTTPLYHGGIADLFRAWTSDAMIWLFPGAGVPITPSNIVHCLKIAEDSQKFQNTPPVKYFSSVPYVLQMMAADEKGLHDLQQMDIVGVGGAALPSEIGDKLVEQNVNLISRFGSAECGFLMSSHRDYAKDKEWQYLRPGEGVDAISFEQRDDGLSELVVLPGWPHMAKRNREDGSYATADLFQPHILIRGAWRCHSRADSQLTLITGKKFDPAPLEAAIATSNLLTDVLIFGNGKPYPGALLFRSGEAKDFLDDHLITALEPILAKINIESQSHVRLARNMLVPMPFSEIPLEKSSKGTILRRKATEQYEADIEQAYTKLSLTDGELVEDHRVSSAVLQIVASAVGRDDGLDENIDLFSYGVDSVACVQIRHAVAGLLPEKYQDLSLTVVEDCGTISKLSELIVSRRHGRHQVNDSWKQEMSSLFEKYSHFMDQTTSRGNIEPQTCEGNAKLSNEVVLLTGATGALGSHILHNCLESDNITQIYCLVRGASEIAAAERVRKAILYRKLRPLNNRVEILCADLSAPLLGLDQPMYQTLASKVTVIHHVAWAVNFRLSVSSFSSNLASVQNLITFALSSPHKHQPKVIFCSSVASVASSPAGHVIKEKISTDIDDCGPLGYSRSKWIAESICDRANETTRLRGRIAVMRVGQLSGATDTGIWNMKEAYPMLLSQVSITSCLPDLQDVPLTWLPVDIAARSFLEVAGRMSDGRQDGLQMYHIVNMGTATKWRDLLGWVRNIQPNVEAVPPAAFVEKLEQLHSKGSKHPAMRLIPHWKEAYGEIRETPEERKQDQASEQTQDLAYEMTKTYDVAPVLHEVRPVDEAYFGKIWRWIQEQELES
jgi:thioester reductase-like protein